MDKKDIKRTSIDAKMKDLQVKSNANFSTTSNDDYTEMIMTSAAKSHAAGIKAYGTIAKASGLDMSKTTIDGHVY